MNRFLPERVHARPTFRAVFLLLALLLPAHFFYLNAQVIRYVKPTGLMSFNYQGPHSWQNNQSYRGLQEAIMASSAGDQIWVAEGMYKSLTDSLQQYGNPDPRLRVFVLKEGVKIYGGFPGLPGQEGDFSVRDHVTYPTILSADINGDDPTPWSGWPNVQPWNPPLDDNAYAIFINQGTLSNATVLDGFILRGANNINAPFEVRTGAINLSIFANPTIRNCTFTDNYNLYRGGAITLTGSSPQIFNCTFNRNIGTGAAIYASANSLIHIENCLVYNNWGGDSGGALSINHGAKVNMINCQFSWNHASVGGALFVYGSHTTIVTAQNCIWWGNGFFDTNTMTINFSQVPGRLIHVSGSSPGTADVKIANSVLWSNGPLYSGPTPNPSTNGVIQVDPGQSAQIDYSVVEYGWPRKGQGIINADPLFINPPFDFNVMAGSPLVNPNMPQLYFVVPYDILGNLRDSNPDLGAYEYDPTLSVSQVAQVQPAILYPNPASGQINVSSPRTYEAYELVDLMGRTLIAGLFPEMGINLPELSRGTYMLRLFETKNSPAETYKFQVR